jgi:hypothetical protein
MHRSVRPEVAGGFGEQTELDFSVSPPDVVKLNYEFSGWLGDDILETYPCFIVTERLRVQVEEAGLTGMHFDSVVISKSEIFDELYPGRELPAFYWAKVVGDESDDFLIDRSSGVLLISEKAFGIISKCCVDNAVLGEWIGV